MSRAANPEMKLLTQMILKEELPTFLCMEEGSSAII